MQLNNITSYDELFCEYNVGSNQLDEVIVQQPNENSNQVEDNEPDVFYASQIEVHAEINQIKLSIEELKGDQKIMMGLQKRICLTVDKLYDLLKSNTMNSINPEVESSVFDSKYTYPIADISLLGELDNDLRESEFNSFFVTKFQRLIGADGMGDGFKLGRILFFSIFSAVIINDISWTGISRTPGVSQKTSFQSFATIIKTLTLMLSKADNRWSDDKSVILLRDKILKHGHQIKSAAITKKKKHLPNSEVTTQECGVVDNVINDANNEAGQNNHDEAGIL